MEQVVRCGISDEIAGRVGDGTGHRGGVARIDGGLLPREFRQEHGMGGAGGGRDRRTAASGNCAGERFETLVVGLNRIVHGQVHDCQVKLARRAGAELNRRPSCSDDRL